MGRNGRWDCKYERKGRRRTICNVNIQRCGTARAISVIAQIAIGNGRSLYTRARTRDNIMASLKIAPLFYGRIVIGKLSGAAAVLPGERGVKSHFYDRPLDPVFTAADDGFHRNFHFAQRRLIGM